jgi:glycosyltransferase involved in cell wall biosynthesis
VKALLIVSHALGRAGVRGVGGPEKRALESLRWVDRAKIEPVIVYSSAGVLFDRFRDAGVRVIDFCVRGIEHVSAARTLTDIARSEGVGVIHTQGPLAADFYAARAARAASVPFVVTRPSMIEDYLMPFLKRSAYAAVDTLVLQSAAAVVAVSEDGRRRLLAKRALLDAEVLLIRNGVDVERYRPREDARARLLSEVGLPGDTPTFGMVGQLTDDKGWDVFLEAVLQIKRSRPRVAAFIVGDGPRRTEIKLSIAHTDLKGTVFMLGLREDVAEILPALDVVLHTSRREGLPVAVIEAMACGRAVVASDAGGTAELVENGVSGFIVPIGDVLASAERLSVLLGDAGLRERMGRAGRDRAVAELTIGRMVSEYEALYERVARRPGRGLGPPRRGAGRERPFGRTLG